jgi:hypothetical protein
MSLAATSTLAGVVTPQAMFVAATSQLQVRCQPQATSPQLVSLLVISQATSLVTLWFQVSTHKCYTTTLAMQVPQPA